MRKYGHGGWWHESQRHSLASRGIRTKKSFSNDYAMIQKMPSSCSNTKYSPKIDYAIMDSRVMKKLQSFLHKRVNNAVDSHPDDKLKSSPEVQEMHSDITKISNWQKFKQWAKKHKASLELMGLGGALGYVAIWSGTPVLMENQATGEMVGIGGTLLGRFGIISQTVLTGMAVNEEVKIISEENSKKLFKDELRKKDMIKVGQLQQKAFIIRAKPKMDYAGESEELSEISSKPIPYSKLTMEERNNLFDAMRKVKKMFAEKGKRISFSPKDTQVVDRVGRDDSAWGAHQDELIQVRRSVLRNPEKLDGVLAHEETHKVYGVKDETRDLENLDIDYMGMLINKKL